MDSFHILVLPNWGLQECHLSFSVYGLNLLVAAKCTSCRDVSFEYPGSSSSSCAIKNVSVSIKAGQLVVVVGSNGSGKSTLVKLLTRLYDPSSGKVLLDNRNLKDYQIAHLRQATATLTQDHQLFPLSLAENIGLGYSSSLLDTVMVTESAKLGGAYDLICKLEKGLQTNLNPVRTTYKRNVTEERHPHLMAEFEKLEKPAEVSGILS
jgi:ABC-type bacteriocin/lantibiotic exporter with double-glycine peptidase domain